MADYVLWLWLFTNPLRTIIRLCPVIVALQSSAIPLAGYVLWLLLFTHLLDAIDRLCTVIVALYSSSWCHWRLCPVIVALYSSSRCHWLLCPVIVALYSLSWCHWPTMSCDCGTLLILLVPLADYVLWLWLSTHPLGAIGWLCPVIVALYSLSWCHWPTVSCDCGFPPILLVSLADYVLWLWLSTHPLGAIWRLCPVIMVLYSLSWCH